MLVRTVECIEGQVEIELVCEPAFDYGRTPGRVDDGRTATVHAADATGAGQTFRLRSDLALGIEGNRVRGRHVLKEGERAYCCTDVGRRARRARATSTRRRRRIAATTRFWRAWLGTRADPRPPLARPDPALRAGDQGPHLHADRRDRRRAHDLAPGDARRRAQLGLPLHVDARHDLHAAGAALAEPRLGGRRVHAVRRRPRGRTRTARCRSCTGSTVAAT